MSADPYELGMTRPARRAISELLPEDVAAAAAEFSTGPLLDAPYRVGKPLRDTLSGFHSARLSTQWRVIYRIHLSAEASWPGLAAGPVAGVALQDEAGCPAGWPCARSPRVLT